MLVTVARLSSVIKAKVVFLDAVPYEELHLLLLHLYRVER